MGLMMNKSVSSGALNFLFVNLILVLSLFIGLLPTWLLFEALLVVLWRSVMYMGYVNNPDWPVKLLLVVSGFTVVYLQYGTQTSIEAMLALLVAGVILKPLEVTTKRDAYVLVFTGYLLLALYFLFKSSPLDYLFVFILLVSNLAAQLSINWGRRFSYGQLLRGAVSTVFKSIPLALFLFFVLPRLAPLWSLNVPTNSGITGLSDSMSPGDVASLSESDELVFQVKFKGEAPLPSDQYWRVLLMDEFDGKTWRQSLPDQFVKEQPMSNAPLPLLEYDVIAQSHDKKWLFTLAWPSLVEADSAILITRNQLLRATKSVLQPIKYKLLHHAEVPINESMSYLERQAFLQLPKGVNPRSKEFIDTLNRELLSADGLVDDLKQFYLSQSFIYSLQPDLLQSDDTIDEFLWGSQKGFCAHYAGSLTYLLRLAGVPARVVMGYQGAELNALENYYSVYQYNAHAWVEYWNGSQWQSVDPTAWVSPLRIEQGVSDNAKGLMANLSRNYGWLNSMNEYWQGLNYIWQEWMLSYNGAAQDAFYKKWFGDIDSVYWALILLGCFSGFMGFIFLFLWWDRKPDNRHTLIKLTELYINDLQEQGLLASNATSVVMAEQILTKEMPALEGLVSEVTRVLQAQLYASQYIVIDHQELRELKAKIKFILRYVKAHGAR